MADSDLAKGFIPLDKDFTSPPKKDDNKVDSGNGYIKEESTARKPRSINESTPQSNKLNR